MRHQSFGVTRRTEQRASFDRCPPDHLRRLDIPRELVFQHLHHRRDGAGVLPLFVEDACKRVGALLFDPLGMMQYVPVADRSGARLGVVELRDPIELAPENRWQVVERLIQFVGGER